MGDNDLSYLNDIWSGCVNNISDAVMRNFLINAKPLSFENNCLRVQAAPFPVSFFSKPNNREQLNQLIASYTGIPAATVQLVASETTITPVNATEASEKQDSKTELPEVARPTQEKVQDKGNNNSQTKPEDSTNESILDQFNSNRKTNQSKGIASNSGEFKATPSKPSQMSNAVDQDRYSRSKLLSELNFESFVRSDNNSFAAAAAEAVSHRPGKNPAYNPLFFYSGVGLGKTHLMNAIGNYVIEHHPNLNVLYVTAEQFLNEMVKSINNGTQESFRKKYRESLDVLLIDDIQFLINKEAAQEEFFHTFNELHNNSKQIVIASDRRPDQIPTLTDRMRSRFKSAMVIDIQPPSLETRIAILRKKCELSEISVPDEVLNYIAETHHSNIRELDGAFVSVINYCALLAKEINLDNARIALNNNQEDNKVPDADTIIREVCEYFNVSEKDILSAKRDQSIVRPRQIAMYIMKTYGNMTFPAIGAKFNRNHTTALHSVSKIENNLKDADIKTCLTNMKDRLKIK